VDELLASLRDLQKKPDEWEKEHELIA